MGRVSEVQAVRRFAIIRSHAGRNRRALLLQDKAKLTKILAPWHSEYIGRASELKKNRVVS